MDGDMHRRMINIPCVLPEQYATSGLGFRVAYKMGHRDARHAAAEIADEEAQGPEQTQPLTDAEIHELADRFGVPNDMMRDCIHHMIWRRDKC